MGVSGPSKNRPGVVEIQLRPDRNLPIRRARPLLPMRRQLAPQFAIGFD